MQQKMLLGKATGIKKLRKCSKNLKSRGLSHTSGSED